MNKRSVHDKALKEILIPQGFFKVKHVFIRYYGDGVIQSVWYNYEPHSWIGDGYILCFSLQSIYERNLFGAENNQPEMTDWHEAAECYAYCHGFSRHEAYQMNEQAQLEVFKTHVLPVLNSLKTQESLYEFSCRLSYAEHGEILYQWLPNLYLTLHLTMYDESHKIVSKRIEHIRDYEEDMKVQMRDIMKCTPDQINSRINGLERELEPFIELKEWLENKKYDRIKELIQDRKEKNIQFYLNFLGSRAREKETQRLLSV